VVRDFDMGRFVGGSRMARGGKGRSGVSRLIFAVERSIGQGVQEEAENRDGRWRMVESSCGWDSGRWQCAAQLHHGGSQASCCIFPASSAA